MRNILQPVAAALLATSAIAAAPAAAQDITQSIAGTRLDLNVRGEVTRVPDLATISTGVTVQAPTASAAISRAAQRMASIRDELKRAGIADRDIQTSNLNLNPQYAYEKGKAPRVTGYQASNELSVRFRNIADSGKVIDALVAAGANNINGPSLSIDKPEAALDEARQRAVAKGRAEAEIYARSLGMRIVRIVSVRETGSEDYGPRPPMPMMVRAEAADASTQIDPGEQKLNVNLAMTFELQ